MNKAEAQAVAEGLSPEAWEVVDLVAASLGMGVAAFIQKINQDCNQDIDTTDATVATDATDQDRDDSEDRGDTEMTAS